MNAPLLKLHAVQAPEGGMSADGVAQSDARATNSASARKLYKARVQIYPKLVHGTFRRLKWIVMAVTLGIYYLLPWIRWNRGPYAPHQAILVDLVHERFYFFFIEIWPQEVYYVTGLLILAAVSLFLATSLCGRLWCGYTCPQTVWTDLFIAVERFFEGDRGARIRLAAEPWSISKTYRKVAKHAIWILIAAGTGGAWVFYFADAPTLAHALLYGTAGATAYGAIAVLTFTTYTLAGSMREQVCTYMCPWPRIQAAMTDDDALSVVYRHDRGEPRGPHKKGQTWEGRGDCIDCRQCIAACPMGIDIRDGAQLECINCGLCIDACDDVMAKVGLNLRLIAYDTEANVERRIKGERTGFRYIRPRTVLYAVVLLIVSAVMLVGLSTRRTMDLDVMRDRNPDFVVLSDGSVRNGYALEMMNRTDAPRTLQLTVSGPILAHVAVIGIPNAGLTTPIAVPADRARTLRVIVRISRSDLHQPSSQIVFAIRDARTGESYSVQSVFISGGS
jgi:cytochrome c oxidase accessory protein FixG